MCIVCLSSNLYWYLPTRRRPLSDTERFQFSRQFLDLFELHFQNSSHHNFICHFSFNFTILHKIILSHTNYLIIMIAWLVHSIGDRIDVLFSRCLPKLQKYRGFVGVPYLLTKTSTWNQMLGKQNRVLCNTTKVVLTRVNRCYVKSMCNIVNV